MAIPVEIDDEVLDRYHAIRDAKEEAGDLEFPTKSHLVEAFFEQWNADNAHYLDES